ncbi:hypothetical protein [Streptomyces sp. CRN 30]|uniref:hypothetical protein n=1 Tax=Streptomyces sp. CRN 30 TaxID=3075613 RepID=UPI002A8309A2|nr:hypothetical protein [Streptomyces sp. CRN 30]
MSRPPFLPPHTAVVLLAAAVIGLVVAVPAAPGGAAPAGAALTGLVAAGVSVPVPRALID